MRFLPLSAIPAALFFSLLSCSSTPQGDLTERIQVPPVVVVPLASSESRAKDSLTLVSVNLAHGRKSSLNQWLVSTGKTHNNLGDIAAFLRRNDADVVALQEADSPSPWSGKFHHVDYLAQQARFPFYVYTEHARLWMGNYGTAVLSKWPVASALGLTFASTPPTASKGFTLAQIQWPLGERKPALIDVVSVHLDFSRESVRIQQLDELVAVLRGRENPLIIMGDFNSEWLAERYLVDSIADKSALHVYQVSSEDLSTYKDKRLDWILVSKDLEFVSYRVATDVLSDHRAVVAQVRFTTHGAEG